MNKIQLLPEHIVNQIKAGEVIERPASLIKEILENSIDAKATRISIHIKNNGLDLIAVEDDGVGMSYQDLPYAFCRHATSKISRFDDLYQLQSYGFRGEALASISSISKITCSSNTIDNDGGKIVTHGSKEISYSKSSSSDPGTSIFISELFYNTPARLKFVKSQTSERNAIKKVINSFLLATPNIHWSIQWDDKEKQIYPKTISPLDRIEKVFFKRKKSGLPILFIEEEYDQYQIEAYVSEESSPGTSGKNQFILVNKRFIIDSQMHRSIMRNLEHVWGIGQSGHYLVKINIPPQEIDVNVHPGKTTVKFLKSSIVFSIVSSVLKKLKKDSPLQPANHSQIPLINDVCEITNLKMNYENSSETDHGQSTNNFHTYQIVNDFYIVRFLHNAPLLVKGSELFNSFIDLRLNQILPLSDSDITPLLVSEPIELIKSEIDQSFPLFKSLGFEIDRLDEKTVALRSIPSFLNTFSNQIIAAFTNLNSIKAIPKSFSNKILHPLFSDVTLSFHQLSLIFDTLSLSELIEMKTVKILDKNNLKIIYEC